MICPIPQNKAAWVIIRKVASHSITDIIKESVPTFQLIEQEAFAVPDDWFCFAFVRNPFDRLVSVWLYFIVQQAEGDSELRRLQRFRPSITSWISFSRFVEEMVRIDPVEIDQHFKPQSMLLRMSSRVDFVGHLENIKEDWLVVAERLGFIQELPVRWVTETKKHFKDYYDFRTAQLVGDYYHQDCYDFGYAFV